MDSFEWNRLIWDIVKQAIAPLERSMADGVVGVVEGDKASVSLNGSADFMPGFTILPGKHVEPGDHVLCYRLGGYQLILDNLTRSVPQAISMDIGLYMDSGLFMDGGT